MTSTPSARKSPFSKLKEQFFGNPEQSLKEAYEAASRIKSIENRYFSGYRVPVESLTSDRLQGEVQENLDILRSGIEQFNSSSAASGNLGSNNLEKLIFAEGILANYTIVQNQPSAIVPVSQPGGESYSSSSIVDVSSTTTPVNVTPPSQQKRKNSSPLNSLFPGSTPLTGSVGKTFDKIKQDLNPKSEEEVVNEFRRSRAVTVVGVRLLALLIIVPIITQQVSKRLVIAPIVDQYRGGEEAAIVIDNLNSEWKEEALVELNTYEEQLKMDRMLKGFPSMSSEELEKNVQEKANEIAEVFHHKSNNSISNVFADFVGIFAFAFVLLIRRNDITVLKSFIDKIIYGLSDSAKAFAIILFTDMFVGFHSPHGWEVLLEGLANHLGVAANQSSISLFIATVPVVMDTMMKYWIFRYLSQLSASTVATLKEMNE
ncbi:MAG: proton extrusion protein PcxA [Pleurocapsa sp. SU_5_0]|nr:proton extrusion protein PcxA [Pleurocapsa sp. SU_5_0]NJR45777.1 proton extrusion protein PcxA [Hyellaceae cyanobacterium CSU_1_1]